jgi:endonuclease YncB( thermonuclease family)
LGLFIVPALGADEIAGAARAFRGDVLIVRGAKVRLFGIVAPAPNETCASAEGNWPCGREAKAALSGSVKGRDVVCSIVAKVGHGSVQATCLLGAVDIAEMIVRAGWARAEPAMSDAYLEAERDARSRQAGMWQTK